MLSWHGRVEDSAGLVDAVENANALIELHLAVQAICLEIATTNLVLNMQAYVNHMGCAPLVRVQHADNIHPAS